MSVEKFKNQIAAGMGIPQKYLEPVLTAHAELLDKLDETEDDPDSEYCRHGHHKKLCPDCSPEDDPREMR